MSTTYTDNVEAVTDAFKNLVINEFHCHVFHGKEFEPQEMTRDEYFRYYLTEQPVIDRFSDGETREYTYDCSWYFNTKSLEYRQTFDVLVSDRIERFKRLFYNNNVYNISGTYVWHKIIIEPLEAMYMTEAEAEVAGYDHVLNVPIIITITRNDYN